MDCGHDRRCRDVKEHQLLRLHEFLMESEGPSARLTPEKVQAAKAAVAHVLATEYRRDMGEWDQPLLNSVYRCGSEGDHLWGGSTEDGEYEVCVKCGISRLLLVPCPVCRQKVQELKYVPGRGVNMLFVGCFDCYRAWAKKVESALEFVDLWDKMRVARDKFVI